MERGFKYLIDMHGIPGARDIFERICINLFQNIKINIWLRFK